MIECAKMSGRRVAQSGATVHRKRLSLPVASILIMLTATSLIGTTCSRPQTANQRHKGPEPVGQRLGGLQEALAKRGFGVEIDKLTLAVGELTAAEMHAQSLITHPGWRLRSRQVLLPAFGLRTDAEPRVAIASAMASEMSAYYSPRTKKLTIRPAVLDSETGEHVLMHELVHAFQDQEHDLAALYGQAATTDALLTLGCTIEGQAETVAHGIALERSGTTLGDVESRRVEESYERARQFGDAPQSRWCYVVGYLHGLRAFKKGGWPAVAALLPEMAGSSEQLLHERKMGTDAPTAVILPPLRSGVTVVHEDTIGELGLFQLLRSAGLARFAAQLIAAGWDGDRLRVVQFGPGRVGAVWRILWDRAEDADQMVTTARQLPVGNAARWIAHGRITDMVLADNEDDASALIAILGDETPTTNLDDAGSTDEVESAIRRRVADQSRVSGQLWVVERYGVSIPILEGWQVVAYNTGSLLLKQLPDGGEATLSVTSQKRGGYSLDQLYEMKRKGVGKPPWLTIESLKRETLSGKEVIRIEASGAPNSSQASTVHLTVLTLRGDEIVNVVVAAPADAWNDLRLQVTSMLRDMKFTELGLSLDREQTPVQKRP